MTFHPDELHCTGNRYADQYIAAARDLGLSVEIISPRRGTVLISGNGREVTVTAAIVGCNNLVAARFSSNKFLTQTRLQAGGFRVPPFRRLETGAFAGPAQLVDELLAFAGQHWPVVLKPLKGHGGVNVFAGLENESDLAWAARQLWEFAAGELLVEKHIHGRHFRIKLLDHEVIGMLERFPASVVGDGVASINELVTRKNAFKRHLQIEPIALNDRVDRVLARCGLTLDSVLPAGQRQPLQVESNQHVGGDTEILPLDTLSTETRDYLARASRYIGLKWVGFDYIVEDIGARDAWRHGYINETSSALVPAEFHPGRQRSSYLDTANRILRSCFGLGTC